MAKLLIKSAECELEPEALVACLRHVFEKSGNLPEARSHVGDPSRGAHSLALGAVESAELR